MSFLCPPRWVHAVEDINGYLNKTNTYHLLGKVDPFGLDSRLPYFSAGWSFRILYWVTILNRQGEILCQIFYGPLMAKFLSKLTVELWSSFHLRKFPPLWLIKSKTMLYFLYLYGRCRLDHGEVRVFVFIFLICTEIINSKNAKMFSTCDN